MKKFGGVLLVTVGLALILFAVLRAVLTLVVILGNEVTAYAMGAIAGTAVIVILFVALGLKSIKKGRSLYANEL